MAERAGYGSPCDTTAHTCTCSRWTLYWRAVALARRHRVLAEEESHDRGVRRRVKTQARHVQGNDREVVVVRAVTRWRAWPGVTDSPAVVRAVDGTRWQRRTGGQ